MSTNTKELFAGNGAPDPRNRKNTLDRSQVYRLWKQLEADKEIIEKSNEKWAPLAAAYSAKLGFLITEANLRAACDEAGIKHVAARSHDGVKSAKSRRRIDRLEDVVEALLMELGQRYDPETKRLAPRLP